MIAVSYTHLDVYKRQLKLYLDYYSADSDTGAGIANFLAATKPRDEDLQKLFEEVNGNAQKA